MAGDKASRWESEFHKAAVDSAVNVAKAIHERRHDPQTSLRLAFKLAEMGVTAWRDLIEIQKKAYPELVSTLLPHAPDLEGALVTDEAIVDVKLSRKKTAEFVVHLENRSRGHLHLVLPRTLHFERRDGADHAILSLTADPYAPLLGPGDRTEVVFTLSDANGYMTKGTRYHAPLEVRSRCGRRGTVMVVVRS